MDAQSNLQFFLTQLLMFLTPNSNKSFSAYYFDLDWSGQSISFTMVCACMFYSSVNNFSTGKLTPIEK